MILAAGKGTRMKSDLPKVLTPVGGRPILARLMAAVKASGLDEKPVVVIGHERSRICDTFNGFCEYAVQEEQLGTGHAVLSAKQTVGDSDAVIVLYGDHPFISSETLLALAGRHEERGNTLTMMTVTVPSFEGWHAAFLYWGRILRGSNCHMTGIREFKDATDEERAIREVNPSLFCFRADWLWENLPKVGTKNVQGEYYLTDLVALAVSQGEKLSSISVAPEEVIGINTPEEQEIAEALLVRHF